MISFILRVEDKKIHTIFPVSVEPLAKSMTTGLQPPATNSLATVPTLPPTAAAFIFAASMAVALPAVAWRT